MQLGANEVVDPNLTSCDNTVLETQFIFVILPCIPGEKGEGSPV